MKRKKISMAKLKRDFAELKKENEINKRDANILKDLAAVVYKKCINNKHNEILDPTVKAIARVTPFTIY